MDKGIYALLFSNPACSLVIGSLGKVRFGKGWHIYVGSARGPGGFARVRRHSRLAAARDRSPRWHVDHLLVSPLFSLRSVVCGPTDEDLECRVAQALGGGGVASFGCSDCGCPSHLFYRAASPSREVKGAMASLGLSPISTTLKKE